MLVLLAASFVIVAVVATAVGIVSKGPSAAAAELERLGSVASSAPAAQLGPGDYFLARSDELRAETHAELTGGASFTVLSRLRIETWVGANGSGYRETTVASSRLASDADRAAWDAAGRPPLPAPGEVRTEHYGPGQAPWFDVRRLPTDPTLLEEVLRSGSVIAWPTEDDAIFQLIGELLAQGNASTELRAALFHVAASALEDVQLVGDTNDPLGRRGVGLYVDGSNARTELIFNEHTSELLAILRYPLAPDGSVGMPATWAASHPTTVVNALPTGALTG